MQGLPLRSGCYKPGAKSRTYHVTIKTDEQIEQLKFQESDAFKELPGKRYKMKAKNSEQNTLDMIEHCHMVCRAWKCRAH